MFDSTGASGLLKQGSKHYSGLEEAMYRNIEACQQLSKMTRSALGPHGMNKMVINYLEKLFVTSDAATILKETDINHPAAKMIAQAAKMQESEAGDGTNLVVSLSGELMSQAEGLLKMGLHPSEILIGYEKGGKKALEILENLTCETIADCRDHDALNRAIKTAIAAKQYGLEDILSELITKASIYAMPKDARKFAVENVRVQKILGGGIIDSEVIHGMVIIRGSETSIRHVEKAKVAVFNQTIEMQ